MVSCPPTHAPAFEPPNAPCTHELFPSFVTLLALKLLQPIPLVDDGGTPLPSRGLPPNAWHKFCEPEPLKSQYATCCGTQGLEVATLASNCHVLIIT